MKLVTDFPTFVDLLNAERSIPENYRHCFRHGLSHMAHISVRESAGAKIINELTGCDVPVLVDPTLMLTKDLWLAIARPDEHKPRKSYILTYFLGDMPVDVSKMINKLAERDNLEMVQLAKLTDKKRYTSGLSEFIDYINSASILFTDSYHGGVFSVLFEKPFVLVDRIARTPSMSSRIDELLSKFELEDRRWTNMYSINDVYKVDFSHVPQILAVERGKALAYLRTALKIEDEG
jgi:hypothetical protein